MNYFFEPVNVNQWNIFNEVKEIGHIETFLATKQMAKKDKMILYVGKQNKDIANGVYAIGTIVSEPYVLRNSPKEYCNNKLSVDVRIDRISYDIPFIAGEKCTEIFKQFRTAHQILNVKKLLWHLNNLSEGKDNLSDEEYSKKVNQGNDYLEMKDLPIPLNIKVNKRENNNKTYIRDPKIGRYALKLAKYKCEIENGHKTFICKGSKMPYLESHHLIPISYQENFKFSLDVPANIVALCSNCHNEIHYGLDAEKLIRKLYTERKNRLENAGIYITIEELLSMYNINL